MATLAALVPRLTAFLEPHGFAPEAAGSDWAHWIRRDDASVVLRAYASNADGGLVSLVMTGAPVPSEVERDLRALLSDCLR